MWVRSPGQKDPLRRAWQPTSVFLHGESHGQRSLQAAVHGGRKELDTTEATKHTWPFRVFTSCFSCYSGKWNWFNKGGESWEENYKIY